MRNSLPLILAPLVAGAIAGPAGAVVRPPSAEALYVRARAAEAAGDAQRASADLTALLARSPGDMRVAQRAYRQAIWADDMRLALHAARILDARGQVPPDGRLLLAIDAIRARDWDAARAAADALEREKLFGFTAPFLRAWIAQGSGKGDALAIVEAAKGVPVAQAYALEQRILLLAAQGRIAEAVAVMPPPNAPDGVAGPVRLLLADMLAGTGAREQAVVLLVSEDPATKAARGTLAEGGRLPRWRDPVNGGVSLLLTRLASDFARQNAAPVGVTLGRLASFAAPDNAAARLVTAEVLASMNRGDSALVTLEGVPADAPVAALGGALRIAVLSNRGDKAEALTLARETAETRDGPADWARVGDVALAMERPAEAADAYGRALAAGRQMGAPEQALWPLLLQQANALDQADDWPAARALLKQAYELAPEEPAVLNQYGYARIARRDAVEEASALIEKASALRPDDAAITDSLGWAHYLRGDAAKAVPLLEKASAGDPAGAEISEHLGDAYWTVGRRFEARYAWRAALVTAADKDRARISAKVESGWSPATAAP